MKKLILTMCLLMLTAAAQAAPSLFIHHNQFATSLTPAQKAMLQEQIALSRVSKDGYYKGIFLAGRVKVVEHFPDINVKIDNYFPDLRVRRVNSLPLAIGEWQFVDSFEDFSIKFVEHFEDISITFDDHFPGVN